MFVEKRRFPMDKKGILIENKPIPKEAIIGMCGNAYAWEQKCCKKCSYYKEYHDGQIPYTVTCTLMDEIERKEVMK